MRQQQRRPAPAAPEAMTDTPKMEDGTDAPGFFTHPRGHIRDRVILFETPDSFKEGQFVGLNGFPFLVQYNKEVDLPRPVIEMMRTRVVERIEKNTETGEETVRRYPRFNFRVVAENVNKVERAPEEFGAFECDVCGEKFNLKNLFASHMAAHARERKKAEAEKKPEA